MELVTRTDAYDDENTIFQVKWDGVRCLAYADENGVSLYNRRLRFRNAQYLSCWRDWLRCLRVRCWMGKS